jgi:D-beta-D-heptose 7-phosphate kinase/D-beta-D-heptose 1-phosphate adenosyltransferase
MERVVWINGCFDVLHYGHFKLIQYAASFGGFVYIGIDSDNRVRELKGDGRPFHTSQQRQYNLECINGVTRVFIFDTDEQLKELIKRIEPDIFVIGSDYIDKAIIGGEFAKEIKFFDRIEGLSTTKLLDE